MDSYLTSYVDRNKDFEIQTEFSETQNLWMDNMALLVIENYLKQTKHFLYFHHYLQLYSNSLEYS